jgi:hypothetical protein
MRINHNAPFHFDCAPVSKKTFTLSASKMSRFFVADAQRDNGKHLVVRADKKLTAFMELESAICEAQ